MLNLSTLVILSVYCPPKYNNKMEDFVNYFVSVGEKSFLWDTETINIATGDLHKRQIGDEKYWQQ